MRHIYDNDQMLEDTTAVLAWSKAVQNFGRYIPCLLWYSQDPTNGPHAETVECIPNADSSHPRRCQEVSLCGLMAFRTIEIRTLHGKNNFPLLLFLLFLFSPFSSSFHCIPTHQLYLFPFS
jgi:hypothetical protein